MYHCIHLGAPTHAASLLKPVYYKLAETASEIAADCKVKVEHMSSHTSFTTALTECRKVRGSGTYELQMQAVV